MSDIPIPPASLERLRAAYAQFEQLAAIVAEAMGIPPGTARHLDMAHGVFQIEREDVTDQLLDGTQAR
jgi:hypothetical protein